MRILEQIARPEYLYQPGRLIRRLFANTGDVPGEQIVELPWKMSIEADSSEAIGRNLAHHGVFELPVVETIFRLVDSRDTVLDAGANIGYMTAAALAAGAAKVIAFEPHPLLFARLARNVERWNATPRFAGRVSARNEAIDSRPGRSTLFVPLEGFARNQGIATLEARMDAAAYGKLEVVCTTLDAAIEERGEPVGLLKIDIEGREIDALKGASRALRSARMRDIVYESFDAAGCGVARLLAGVGYSIFRLRGSLAGPLLCEAGRMRGPSFGEHNFLATLDPERARRRIAPRGYKCLSRRAWPQQSMRSEP